MSTVLTTAVALCGIALAAHIFATVGRGIRRGDPKFVRVVKGAVTTPRPRAPLKLISSRRA